MRAGGSQQNSRETRGEIAKLCLTVIACDKREAFAQGSESDEAIHSFFALRHGLLRFARNDDLNAIIFRCLKFESIVPPPGSAEQRAALILLRPQRRAFHRMARVFAVAGAVQRGKEIFLALALESFLGGFEIRHARGDLFALARAAVLVLGHAYPFRIVSGTHLRGRLGRELGFGVAGL
jgi:hypothetical protein